jgi:hypothetical protein
MRPPGEPCWNTSRKQRNLCPASMAGLSSVACSTSQKLPQNSESTCAQESWLRKTAIAPIWECRHSPELVGLFSIITSLSSENNAAIRRRQFVCPIARSVPGVVVVVVAAGNPWVLSNCAGTIETMTGRKPSGKNGTNMMYSNILPPTTTPPFPAGTTSERRAA